MIHWSNSKDLFKNTWVLDPFFFLPGYPSGVDAFRPFPTQTWSPLLWQSFPNHTSNMLIGSVHEYNMKMVSQVWLNTWSLQTEKNKVEFLLSFSSQQF